MDRLVRFGEGTTAVTFPVKGQVSVTTNFENVQPVLTNIPGMDGAFDEYGLAPSPAGVGSVQATFWYKNMTTLELQSEMDAYKKMVHMGVQRLHMQPSDGAKSQRWTWARLNAAPNSQNVRAMPHLRRQIQYTFSVPRPVWENKEGELELFLNDGHTFGDALSMAGTRYDQQTVSDGSTASLTNNGNFPAPVYIRWDGNGTDSFTNPILKRKDTGGQVVEQVSYTGTIGANEAVIIDARTYRVIGNFDNCSFRTSSWLTVPPGTWTIEVSGTFVSDAVLTLDFYDTYK